MNIYREQQRLYLKSRLAQRMAESLVSLPPLQLPPPMKTTRQYIRKKPLRRHQKRPLPVFQMKGMEPQEQEHDLPENSGEEQEQDCLPTQAAGGDQEEEDLMDWFIKFGEVLDEDLKQMNKASG